MEIKYFIKAIELAKSVKCITSPNPAVGCVIVKKGKIISYGSTQKCGFDHAEIVALKNAKENAKNSDLYVTLEPCVYYEGKKTKSCTDEIIKSGIKRVFVGMIDPNPNIYGKGINQLRSAGIEVHVLNEFQLELLQINEDFFKYIKYKIPFVYAKYAMTLDGNIATSAGDSKWISCEESRKWVHNFRNRIDAIMVGSKTVLNDNPQLTVRLVEKIKNPIRIIIDPYCEINENFYVMNDENQTIFVIRNLDDKKTENFIKLCEKFGKEVIRFNFDINTNHFNLKELISYLAINKNIVSILLEGGSKILYNALNQNIIDKLIVFISPKLIGGSGIPPFNGCGLEKMSNSLSLYNTNVENIGSDILIQGYLYDPTKKLLPER